MPERVVVESVWELAPVPVAAAVLEKAGFAGWKAACLARRGGTDADQAAALLAPSADQTLVEQCKRGGRVELVLLQQGRAVERLRRPRTRLASSQHVRSQAAIGPSARS